MLLRVPLMRFMQRSKRGVLCLQVSCTQPLLLLQLLVRLAQLCCLALIHHSQHCRVLCTFVLQLLPHSSFQSSALQ
jgi:hypothetical protein